MRSSFFNLALVLLTLFSAVLHADIITSGQITNPAGLPLDILSIAPNDTIAVGFDAAGSMTINDDSLTNGRMSLTTGLASIGLQPGSLGAVDVSGRDSMWTSTGTIQVGFEGEGSLAITNGAGVDDIRASVGSAAGSGGEVTVSGFGSSWATRDILTIGERGQGTLNVDAGARVTTRQIFVSNLQTATGNVSLSGASTRLESTFLVAGRGGGRANVEIDDSATLTAFSASLGAAAGSSTAVTLRGSGSSFNVQTDVVLGDAGNADLRIGSDSNVAVGGNLTLGESATGEGTLAFSIANTGQGSIDSGMVTVDGAFNIGPAGIGWLELAVDDDASLTPGQQFTLVDYGTWNGGLFAFEDPMGSVGLLADGTLFSVAGGREFLLDYDTDLGGTGDFAITATFVPEPGVSSLLFFGLLAHGFLCRSRTRST